jgi:hypothetical protein
MSTYDRDMLMWAILAPWSKKKKKPPRLPSILRGR